MIEFKLLGIPVRVEPNFWFTLGLVGLIGSNIRSANGLLDLALFILAGFVSLLIHEMGHALMIKKYQLPTQIVLSNFGGYATYPAGILNRVQSFLVTAAGPGLQVIVALATLLVVYRLLPGDLLQDNMLTHFIDTFITISLFWAALNCLPIHPLDGGQMLAAILGPKRQSIVHLISMITAGLMIIVAYKFGALFGALFCGMFAYQNYKAWQQSKS